MTNVVSHFLLQNTLANGEQRAQGYTPRFDKQWNHYTKDQGFNDGL